MLVKQVVTDKRQWRCQISGALFDTRKEALSCATKICQQQTQDGIPAATPIKERRKLYRAKSLTV